MVELCKDKSYCVMDLNKNDLSSQGVIYIFKSYSNEAKRYKYL